MIGYWRFWIEVKNKNKKKMKKGGVNVNALSGFSDNEAQSATFQLELCHVPGNMLNSKGNNKSKIEDRMSKARTCIVESLALCSEITLVECTSSHL